MAITKRRELHQVIVDKDMNLSVREDVVIEEDGVEVARKSIRQTFRPGDDVSGVVGNKVTKIANAVWS